MTPVEEHARERLSAHREALIEIARTRREERLTDLLRQVDAALAALDQGHWGICAVCHDPISAERMGADPLARVCLECLTTEERRALERDLVSAAAVQRALLPPPALRHGGWEVAYHWEPYGAVSGDHVDFIPPLQEQSAIAHLVVGDVAGKGVAASLLQSNLHALFRALDPAGASLEEMLGRANRLFASATLGSSYATLVLLRLHADGLLELANAGHPRPLLADSRGVRPLEGAGVPLGLFAESKFEPRQLRLREGQTLLLYSDGWTEAARGDDQYGIGRAAASFRRVADRPLEELLAACRADHDRFLAGARREDDFTLVAVRRAAAG